MSAWKPPQGRGQQVYYLLPANRLASLLGSEFAPLGPLAALEPAPACGPSYGPRQKASEPAGAPRGFFLDRYVY